MDRTIGWLALAALALAGCGKTQEAASQKAAEKVIESSLQKDGTQAKVDLSAGQMKVTTTDASGKTSTAEYGGAKVEEADVGVAEQFLHRAQVAARLQQVRREAVPQHVRVHMARHAGLDRAGAQPRAQLACGEPRAATADEQRRLGAAGAQQRRALAEPGI